MCSFLVLLRVSCVSCCVMLSGVVVIVVCVAVVCACVSIVCEIVLSVMYSVMSCAVLFFLGGG